ncbi:hypothetical protein ACFSHP_15060 [Novosphingobium panipatense]
MAALLPDLEPDQGPRAGDNPHDATGLEWQTSSPPPKNNFASPPIVEVEPYRYHPEGFAPHEVEQTHAPQVPQ